MSTFNTKTLSLFKAYFHFFSSLSGWWTFLTSSFLVNICLSESLWKGKNGGQSRKVILRHLKSDGAENVNTSHFCPSLQTGTIKPSHTQANFKYTFRISLYSLVIDLFLYTNQLSAISLFFFCATTTTHHNNWLLIEINTLLPLKTLIIRWLPSTSRTHLRKILTFECLSGA